ncbi:rho GTPase-activating protein 24-like [Discoglossus pictus]
MLGETSSSSHVPGSGFPKETCEGLVDTVTSLGSPEKLEGSKIRKKYHIFLSSSELPTSQSSLHYLFWGLNLQISKQKANYETKLKSLEQRNNELTSEIQTLHSKLEQQKKWYNILEIKRRNAERAREDAEQRNEKLQREMEEFYKTFGELTNNV